MTNYYVSFDASGNQEQIRLGQDIDNPSIFYDTGLEDITNKNFKLVDGQAVALTPEEVQAKYANLAYNSGLTKAKNQRNTLLFATDWTQNSDVALSESQKQAWATYRQSLRDLPDSVNADGTFVLPVAPDPSFNDNALGIGS